MVLADDNDVFGYTAIRQNQLLHIRLGGLNFKERWIALNIEGQKIIGDTAFRLFQRFILRWNIE
ncbi:hypothetical protein GV764_15330 [Atlantibacter hermannii]|nr:hypothetical protein [Atlantibacter hermannii]NBD00386.1 hypothetical protein [Atlantibacter hermannii]